MRQHRTHLNEEDIISFVGVKKNCLAEIRTWDDRLGAGMAEFPRRVDFLDKNRVEFRVGEIVLNF